MLDVYQSSLADLVFCFSFSRCRLLPGCSAKFVDPSTLLPPIEDERESTVNAAPAFGPFSFILNRI